MSYEPEQLQLIVEGAILAAGEPVTLNRLQTLFEENEMPDKEALEEALEHVARKCEGRGFTLVEVASGYRFQVREDLATWVNRLWEEKPQKYSRALLETLALIAYRQPITRGDIEEVRGVAVSSHIIKTLVEREWVKVVGHRDVPGRPALYATTRQFLDYFNLKSLDELPTLGELRDIDSLNETLEFENLPPEVQESVLAAASAAASEDPGSGTEDGAAEAAGSEPNIVDVEVASEQEESVSASREQEELDYEAGEADAPSESDPECLDTDAETAETAGSAPEESESIAVIESTEPALTVESDMNTEAAELTEDELSDEPDPGKLQGDSLFASSDSEDPERDNQ